MRNVLAKSLDFREAERLYEKFKKPTTRKKVATTPLQKIRSMAVKCSECGKFYTPIDKRCHNPQTRRDFLIQIHHEECFPHSTSDVVADVAEWMEGDKKFKRFLVEIDAYIAIKKAHIKEKEKANRKRYAKILWERRSNQREERLKKIEIIKKYKKLNLPEEVLNVLLVLRKEIEPYRVMLDDTRKALAKMEDTLL